MIKKFAALLVCFSLGLIVVAGCDKKKEEAPASGAAAPAEGDAAPAEGDAAPAEGDAAPAEGSGE